MDFLNADIENYITQHTEKEPELLQQLNHETWEKVLMPRMLSGHLQGRVLSMMSCLIHPKNVLEIGTYTGYSALCFAEGLQKGGKIHTIDINVELETMVAQYIQKSGYENTIIQHIGNAIDIIPKLNETFDLIFIDADKTNYSNYYDIAFDKLTKGGVIIADNVLWSGKVVDLKEENDLDTKALKFFCKKVQNDKRVQNVLFPIRDGLMVIRKK